MMPATFIEISKSALKQNHEFIQSLLLPDVKFSSVIKGNAYGHGIEVIVPLLENLGVNHFSVFNGDEALRVKKIAQDSSDIMVMGMLTKDQLEWAIEKDIEFYVFDLYRLHLTLALAKKMNKRARIHLEVETGMNRTGIANRDLPEALHILSKNPDFLALQGVCTHLAGAESIANYYRITQQFSRYNSIVTDMANNGSHPQWKHVACSAGMIRYPKTQLDLVRVGIMQYGFFPTSEVMINYFAENNLIDDPLKRVLSWKSQIMSLKDVKMGEFIGYGTAYFASKNMRIATIPIGYSYGFARALTNQGKVLIRGLYAPVVGIVNMNMISVDVTDIPSTEIGDKVVIIGEDSDKDITVSSFSDISNQVNYELLTRLPTDIPRIAVE